VKKAALVAAMFAGLSTTAGAMSHESLRRLHAPEGAAVNAQVAPQGARVIHCHPATAAHSTGSIYVRLAE
jgi:hypothetical protein